MVSKKLGSAIIGASIALFTFSIAFGQSDKEAANSALMKRFYEEVVNQGNLDLMDELISEDFVEHEEAPGMQAGREGVKEFFTMFRQAFPDLKFTVKDHVAKGDKVWSYITITGTQKGDFMGVPASGKKIDIAGFDIVRFKDGKAVEHWGLTDSMKMMEQIGAMGGEEEE